MGLRPRWWLVSGWCAISLLASCAKAGDSVIPLGESGDGAESYPPGMDSEQNTAEEVEARVAAQDAANSGSSIDAPAPLDPWGKEAVTWKDHLADHVETGVGLNNDATTEMARTKEADTNTHDEFDGTEDVPKLDTSSTKTSFATKRERDAALNTSPYDIASKISPIKFNIIVPPDPPNPKADETTDAISGREEAKFTKMITSMEGEKSQGGENEGSVGEADGETEEQLMQEMKGPAYMQAEDDEEQKEKQERLEKAAKDAAVDNAVRIKAEAIADERKNAATAAVEHIKEDEAHRAEDKKAEKVAEQSASKGWLKPELSAELVLEQKRKVEEDGKKLRSDREHEIEIKKEAKMNEEELHQHKKKHRALAVGKKVAEKENDKELAMKFVQEEFERRKKHAFKEQLKQANLNEKMRFTAELMAKKDAAKENTAKSKESVGKGAASEKQSKHDAVEKEKKLVAASHKPKPTNCKVSPWGAWTPCSRPCSGGVSNRARKVMKAQMNKGADCPDLAQSKPCNSQPCLTVTFNAGYCDNALKECTRSRALMKGCLKPASGFGNGKGVQGTMAAEQAKVDEQISSVQKNDNDDEDEDDSGDEPSSNDESPADPDDAKKMSSRKTTAEVAPIRLQSASKSTVAKVPMIATKNSGKASSGHKQIRSLRESSSDAGLIKEIRRIERSGNSKKNVHRQQAKILPDSRATSAAPQKLKLALPAAASPGITVKGTDAKGATVHFQFHHGGKGDTAVVQAVAAAEQAITTQQGAAATKYNFNIVPTPRSAIGDVFLDETPQSRTGAEVSQRKEEEDGEQVIAQEKQAQCNKAKDEVARYCGMMADCVTKSLDKQDIDYSRELTKRVVSASKDTGLDSEDDQAARNEIDEDKDSKQQTKDRVESMIPPSSGELQNEEVQFKQMSASLSPDAKLQRMLVNRLIGTKAGSTSTAAPSPVAMAAMEPLSKRQAGTPPPGELLKTTVADFLKSQPKTASQTKTPQKSQGHPQIATGPEQQEGAGLFPNAKKRIMHESKDKADMDS